MSTGNVPPAQQPSYEVPPDQAGYQQPSQGGYQAPQQQYNFVPQAIPVRQSWGSATKEKWVAAALAAFLGPFGIHKFYLGYKQQGQTMLLVTLVGGLFTFGLALAAMGVVSIIEAVNYVILTQEDFERVYVYGYKAWF